MRKLEHSRMEPGEDPDTYFVRIEQLIDDLAVLDEPITQHRKMDVILNGLTSDYNLVKFQAMKDSELSLDDLMLMMRNLYVNGLIRRPGYTNHRGSAMFSDGSMTMDKSRLKCHGCGKFGHFKIDCRANTAGRGRPSRKVDTSSTKKATARNTWCSFHKSTSHNDSDCYKLKQLDTMQPRAGNKSHGNAHTAMAQTWHKKNGSDRMTHTRSPCVGNRNTPSAGNRRDNGREHKANTAVHTMQSYDEEQETEKHMYAGSDETHSDESMGFSFSVEDAQQVRTEPMQKAYAEEARTSRRATHQHSQNKATVRKVVPETTRRETVQPGGTENGWIPSVQEEEEEMETMGFAFASHISPTCEATNQNSQNMATVDTVVTTTREQAESGESERDTAPSAQGNTTSSPRETTNQNNRKTDMVEKVVTTTREQAESGETGRFTATSVGHEIPEEYSSPRETQTAFISTHQEHSLDMTMVVDSGASSHYVDDKLIKGIKTRMFEFKTLEKPSIITTAGMHQLHGTATGKLRVKVTDSHGEKKTVILPVTIVSGIGRHLFSSVAAQTRGFKTTISDDPSIENSTYKFPLHKKGQLFMINMEILERPRTAITQTALLSSQTTIWHQRLGHINEASMKTLRDQPGTGVSFKDPLTPCGTCALGKSAQKKHPKTSNETTTTPFELVFTDLAGPFKTALDGSRYISKFTDHNTRFKAVYTVHSKDQAFETLNYFIQDYVIPQGLRIQRLRCDKGGEYMAHYYQDFCKETGIVQEFAATNTPQQNGISERDGRTILNMTRCLLVDTGLPKYLWAELCATATYLINRAPHSALNGDSPYMRLYGKIPKLSALRVIGARAFVHIETHIHKLEKKAWEGVMVGYGKDSRSYRIYNPHNRRITESRNVTFIETPPRNLTKSKIDTSLAENEAEKDTAYEEDVLDHLSLIQSSSNGDTHQSKHFLSQLEEVRRNEPLHETGGASSTSVPPSEASFGQPSEMDQQQEENDQDITPSSSEQLSPTPEQRQYVVIPRQTRSAGPVQPTTEEDMNDNSRDVRALRPFLRSPGKRNYHRPCTRNTVTWTCFLCIHHANCSSI